MILITGGTGNVGSDLLPLLVERSASIRAIAHTPDSRTAIDRLGVEAVEADFDEPESLEPAMAGCERLFLLSPTHPDLVNREVAVIDAARRAGVSHIVKLSTVGADAGSQCSLLSRHGEVEDHLIASGLNYTILRPACFMQVHLLPVHTVKADAAWYGMTGDGAHAYIDTRDIATVAATVLTTPGHDRKTYELSGPQAITLREAAAQLSDVLGWSVAYVDVPAGQFHDSLIGAGFPDWLTEGVVALYQIIRDGHLTTVTGFVEQLTGRPARPYREFAHANRDAFVAA